MPCNQYTLLALTVEGSTDSLNFKVTFSKVAFSTLATVGACLSSTTVNLRSVETFFKPEKSATSLTVTVCSAFVSVEYNFSTTVLPAILVVPTTA
ncbi:hypothetical protein D3C87_1791630 [compost metagenome]